MANLITVPLPPARARPRVGRAAGATAPRPNTVAMTATGSWSIYRSDRQFSGRQALDEAYVPFFGAFGTAWDDAMIARRSSNRHALARDGGGVRDVGWRKW